MTDVLAIWTGKSLEVVLKEYVETGNTFFLLYKYFASNNVEKMSIVGFSLTTTYCSVIQTVNVGFIKNYQKSASI